MTESRRARTHPAQTMMLRRALAAGQRLVHIDEVPIFGDAQEERKIVDDTVGFPEASRLTDRVGSKHYGTETRAPTSLHASFKGDLGWLQLNSSFRLEEANVRIEYVPGLIDHNATCMRYSG